MRKGRQHYVPHLYIKHFYSAYERVNVLTMKNFKTYEDNKSRNVCYGKHFYGADKVIEDRLEKFETIVARSFRESSAHRSYRGRQIKIMIFCCNLSHCKCSEPRLL